MAGGAKADPVFRKRCVEDHEEAWEISPEDLERWDVEGSWRQLQASLDFLKKHGVQCFSYGGIIRPGVGEYSSGYPSSIRFQRDRSYAGEELASLHTHLMAPGWFLLDHLPLLFPDDVVLDLVQIHLEFDLGDEHLPRLITGRVTTIRTDGQMVREPIRLM